MSNITNVYKPVGNSSRLGFETAISLPSDNIPQFIRGVALDTQLNVLGATDVLDLATGRLTNVSNPIDIVPMSVEFNYSDQDSTLSSAQHNGSASVPDGEEDSAMRLGLPLILALACLAVEV